MSTYTPIASLTLSANTSSVTFSGIPQNYTDLILVIWSKPYTNSEGSLKLNYNSDTSSNYSNTVLFGDGTSVSSSRNSNSTNIAISSGNALNNPRQPMFTIQIMNYSNTTTYKTSLTRTSEGGSSLGYVDSWVGTWRSTAAITSLTIGVTYIFDIGAGSTFSLYGIDAQASAQAKATGGSSIYTDGTYWYHVFNSSGTFTPTQNLSNVDFLVVAGGGGGYVQGGGAGGFRTSAGTSGANSSAESKINLSSNTAYTVTIGAGGMNGNRGVGGNGSNSSISGSGLTTITSTGGGGTSTGGSNGNNGGSGGGAFNSGTAGSGTANQGLAGGAAPTANAGGGGGGAGVAGSAGSGSAGGNGGNGIASSITGSSITYAGGGAGYGTGSSGTAGTGGGGTPSATASVKNGTSNTGGGGGGYNAGNGGIGGSGIVIFRYSAV